MVAVDVGTSKVCTIVARREGAQHVRILSHGVVPSEGLQRGNVTNTAEAGRAIGQSVRQAAQKASASVRSAYVGITGSHVSFENRLDNIDWVASRGVITRSDLDRVPQTVAAAGEKPGQQVIHALPRNYTLDGQSGIRDPLGMHTRRLEVESHVVSAERLFVRSLTAAVEDTGLRVEALVLEPMASAEAVLTEYEKYTGAVLVDIGGGTSDIIVFERGVVEYTSVLPIGGFQFTNDICVAFETTYEAAEAAKLEYGTTEPVTYKALDEIVLPSQGRSARTVALRDFSQLLRERAMEVVRLIRLKMMESGIRDPSSVSVVLTGGSSRLPGLEAMARRYLASNVRVGGPAALDVPQELRGPEFSTSVGLLRWAMNHPGGGPSRAHTGHTGQEAGDKPGSKAPKIFRWLFPN